MLEIQRIERYENDWSRLEMANLTAIAHHDPKGLDKVAHKLRSRMALVPSREDVMRQARETLAASQTQPVTHRTE